MKNLIIMEKIAIFFLNKIIKVSVIVASLIFTKISSGKNLSSKDIY